MVVSFQLHHLFPANMYAFSIKVVRQTLHVWLIAQRKIILIFRHKTNIQRTNLGRNGYFFLWQLEFIRKGLVPKDFSSPGMMAALFDGTNAAKYIPANAGKLPPNELHKMMEGARFRMGWFMKESSQTLHYTIGVVDDEDFTFMGSKAEIAAMESHRVRAD